MMHVGDVAMEFSSSTGETPAKEPHPLSHLTSAPIAVALPAPPAAPQCRDSGSFASYNLSPWSCREQPRRKARHSTCPGSGHVVEDRPGQPQALLGRLRD